MVRTERYLKIRLHENMLLFISFFNINSTSTAWILDDALVYLSHKNSTEL